jgi:anti-sigma factor ChrR (cupin superfamily)
MLQKIPARTAQRQALRAAAREASDAARLDALMALPDQPPRSTRRMIARARAPRSTVTLRTNSDSRAPARTERARRVRAARRAVRNARRAAA